MMKQARVQALVRCFRVQGWRSLRFALVSGFMKVLNCSSTWGSPKHEVVVELRVVGVC